MSGASGRWATRWTNPGRTTRTGAGGPRPRRARRRAGATRRCPARPGRRRPSRRRSRRPGARPGRRRARGSARGQLAAGQLLASRRARRSGRGSRTRRRGRSRPPWRASCPCPCRPCVAGVRDDRVRLVAVALVHGVRGATACVRPPTPSGDASSPTSARVRPQPSTSSSEEATSLWARRATSDGQVLAVPVGEDRALGLTVVGEDHEPVLPRRRAGHQLQLVEDAVDGLERLEALRPQDAGVVGDLVVVDEVDVDRADAPAACAGRPGSC